MSLSTTSRRYGDPCGVARALDVVGERWALLVVRELLLGPKRFSDLQAGLAGVSANVLSQRLRDLGRSGIVRRRRLGPPARTAAYELTEEGHALEPILGALSGWGRRRPLPESGELSVDALVLALRTSVDFERAGDLTVTVDLALDDDELTVRLDHGVLQVRRGVAEDPQLRLRTTAAAVRAMAFAQLPVRDAVRQGRLEVSGEPDLAQRFFDVFRR